jgi:hypothetical protein
MRKFDKAKKTRCSGFWFRTFRFWQFQGKVKNGAKLEDLKIQGSFEHERGRQGIKGPRQMRFKLKVEVTKIGWFGLGF